MLMRKPIIPDDAASKCFFSKMECKQWWYASSRARFVPEQDKRAQERLFHPELVQGTAVAELPSKKTISQETPQRVFLARAMIRGT